MNWTGRQFNQDRAAQQTYAFAMDPRNLLHGSTGERCCHCGGHLEVYYCEDRLYMIRCMSCGVVALAEAGGPIDAAKKTLGISTTKKVEVE